MKKSKGMFWLFLGLLLIVAALSLIAYNLYDENHAKRSTEQAVDRLNEYLNEASDLSSGVEKIPDYILNPEMEMPTKTINGVDYIGVLQIPKLELELPVIRQWSYPHLKIAPCQYSGSVYLDTLVIAGHNYVSHFGNLKKLREGDVVLFTDMDGNTFRYTVVCWETLDSAAVEEMKNGDWDLTLFTCTIRGRNRVTVRCEREKAVG